MRYAIALLALASLGLAEEPKKPEYFGLMMQYQVRDPSAVIKVEVKRGEFKKFKPSEVEKIREVIKDGEDHDLDEVIMKGGKIVRVVFKLKKRVEINAAPTKPQPLELPAH